MKTWGMMAAVWMAAVCAQAAVSRPNVLFLASDEAKFIIGALLPVDGGQGVRVG